MAQPTPNATRGGFSTSFGILAATLGSAVGLGNIWKVPYLTGANGGAGFLLIYLLATLLIGLPVMMAEIALGRSVRANPIKVMRTLTPGRQPWWLVGLSGMLAAFLIMSFYSEVVAWVFAYILKAVRGTIMSSDPTVTQADFAQLVADPLQSLLWQWMVLAAVASILIMGVAQGIEAITKKLMPLLFILLLILGAVGLTLDGAQQAMQFLFWPDFSKITATVVLTAMGLAFFKLSIGMGTMMTYGSYFTANQNIPQTAVRVMLADLSFSMLAGVAIFPAVFTFGFTPSAGPSLVFITLPAVFSQIPFGHGLMVVFFVLTAVAAMGAMLSLMEVPTVILQERFNMQRSHAVLLATLLVALPGAGSALSSSVLAHIHVAGFNLFDLPDFVSSNILLPAGGIVIALFTGWVWGRDKLQAELSNHGQLRNAKLTTLVFVLLRYVTPLLIALVMLRGLGVV